MSNRIRRSLTNSGARPCTRRGMTLIEIMVAMAILTGAMLGMGSFVVNFVREVSTTNIRSTAGQLVSDRLEQVKTAPRYIDIDNYATTETSISGFSGYSRQTLVKQVGGGVKDLWDYKIVTVIVNAPGLSNPLRKSTVIAAF